MPGTDVSYDLIQKSSTRPSPLQSCVSWNMFMEHVVGEDRVHERQKITFNISLLTKQTQSKERIKTDLMKNLKES